jgi:anti-sigma B factor antagonist
MGAFEVEVVRRGSVVVARLRGQLDGSATAALDRAYDHGMQEPAGALLLRFDGVDYINSTGIALIVGLLGRARSSGVEVLVCGLSEHYQHIFEITRLTDFVRSFPDEEAAVGAQPVG